LLINTAMLRVFIVLLVFWWSLLGRRFDPDPPTYSTVCYLLLCDVCNTWRHISDCRSGYEAALISVLQHCTFDDLLPLNDVDFTLWRDVM